MLGILIVLATVISLYLAARSHLRYRARNDLIYAQRFEKSRDYQSTPAAANDERMYEAETNRQASR